MQRLKNYSILSLTIAILGLSLTTSGQMQEPRVVPTEPSPKLVCRGKPVAVTLLERPFGLKLHGRRMPYLMSGISQRTRLVIRNREEFNELWQQIVRQVSDKPPLPEVDFSREMLVVAATGVQQTRNEIIIDGACEVDNQLEVLVRTTKFLPCGAEIEFPHETLDIVRVAKTDLPLVFRETEVTCDCPATSPCMLRAMDHVIKENVKTRG